MDYCSCLAKVLGREKFLANIKPDQAGIRDVNTVFWQTDFQLLKNGFKQVLLTFIKNISLYKTNNFMYCVVTKQCQQRNAHFQDLAYIKL